MSNTDTEKSKKTDFERIFDCATKLCPNLIPRNNSVIYVWLSEGCDVDKDIIPTIETIGKKKPDLSSFSYFTPAIKQARETRRNAEKIFSEEGKYKKISDERRAEIIEFREKMGMFINRCDRIWIENYKQERDV